MTRKKSAPPGQRQLRVGEELRHALSAILAEDHLNDPDLKGRAVTVTLVRVSPDLTNATAFVVPMFGQADAAAAGRIVAALNRATAFFRGRLAARVDLRVSPKLRFLIDESVERAHRIEALLRDPAVQRDIAAGPKRRPDDGA
jgi:ribosome-binding factor A